MLLLYLGLRLLPDEKDGSDEAAILRDLARECKKLVVKKFVF